MSVLTKAIGVAKRAKHSYREKKQVSFNAWLSPVRRIERVNTDERICALTFDDGPCRMPPSREPDGPPLTVKLLETLEHYGAKGTFDVVGDTSGNYPDQAGKPATAAWGGIKYDHYPDIHHDGEGGVLHCMDLAQRILEGGHELTNHTYSHVLFGRKNIVYGRREHFTRLEQVTGDLEKLHKLVKDALGYEMKLSRPPHYVDKIAPGITSYEAYALTGYQYMAASFDGAGWLPLSSYQAEVEAVWKPAAKRLEENPDYFCGQIIFHKDGFNMARRTPVADGLGLQLEELKKRGYQVVTVSELLERSAFRDVAAGTAAATGARALLHGGWCVAFRDNTLRPDTVLTRGALAMMAFGCQAVGRQVAGVSGGQAGPFSDVKRLHPYSAAMEMAVEAECMVADSGAFAPERPVTAEELDRFCRARFGTAVERTALPITHGAVIELLAELIK